MAGAFKRKRGTGESRVRVDLSGTLATRVRGGGLADADLEAGRAAAAEAAAALAKRRRAGGLPVAALAEGAGLKDVTGLAKDAAKRFDDLVVLGVGPGLGGVRALLDALGDGGAPVRGMRVHVADSLDPAALVGLLGGLDLARTLFNVVSRTGDSAENLSRFLVVRGRLLKERGGVEYKQHVVITTDATAGALRQIVNDEGFRALVMPAGLAPRFAPLSAAGLFPAACAGFDVAAVVDGAAAMDERVRGDDPTANPALAHALALHLGTAGGRAPGLAVVPCADALAATAEWARALAAWSGRGARVARLPLAPDDPPAGVHVFLRVDAAAVEVEVPRSYEDLEAASYLGKQSLGALADLGRQAAEVTLWQAGGLTTGIVCPSLAPHAVGQLFHLLALEAVFARGLGGLDPAGEPAPAKGATPLAALAGRPGLEGARAEAQRLLAGREDDHVL